MLITCNCKLVSPIKEKNGIPRMSVAGTSNLNFLIRKGIFKLFEKQQWHILFMTFCVELLLLG